MYILRSINATNQFFHLFAEDIIIAHTFVFQETLEISEFFGSHLQIFADENRRKASVPPASTVAGDVIKPQARKPPQLQIVRYLRDGRRLDGPAVTTTTQCAPGRHVPTVSHRTPFQPFSPAQASSGDGTSLLQPPHAAVEI